MGDKITVDLEERTLRGKKAARLRQQSIVPGIVYGASIEPALVQLEENVLEKVYKAAGKHSPVHVTMGKKKRIAMIKDIERDPVRGKAVHVSFHAVKQNEPVIAQVPIHLVGEGESEAERAGLVVLQTLEHLEVKALPMDLPESLEVSLLDLKKAGDRLTVADIKVPENVELVDNDDGREGTDDDDQSILDLVVANVYEPSALQAANDAAGGDAEDVSEVESENGTETSQSDQAAENRPGDGGKEVPKVTNVDSNK